MLPLEKKRFFTITTVVNVFYFFTRNSKSNDSKFHVLGLVWKQSRSYTNLRVLLKNKLTHKIYIPIKEMLNLLCKEFG